MSTRNYVVSLLALKCGNVARLYKLHSGMFAKQSVLSKPENDPVGSLNNICLVFGNSIYEASVL